MQIGEKMMLRLLAVSALCLSVLSGCAAAQKIAHKDGSSDTPLAQVLKERPDLRKELATVEIRQLTETGLMDDSVRSVRTIYRFKNVAGDWERTSTQKEYQCQRGKNTKAFQTAVCP